MNKFIGRQQELKDLERFLSKKTASLIVVKGRRRIGKSRLIAEFAQRNKVKFYSFIGLPPEKNITAQIQRNEFTRQLKTYKINVADDHRQDWGDLFYILAKKTSKEKVLILLDEISWLATDDVTFHGKLKTAWDVYFKQNANLILVICGSVSTWIEKNILSGTGFVGRISYTMNLEELPLSDCNKFWDKTSGFVAPFEKIKVLSITAGVPRYLEEINTNISAEDNIRNIMFKKGGFLFAEFEQIFHDIFSKRSRIYKNLLENILYKKYTHDEIYNLLDVEKGGLISEYLSDLEAAGFVKRDFTWNINTGKSSKLSHYRISDNYVRFYLKYVEPNKDLIERGVFSDRTLASLPGWQVIMGLQFENLVLANRHSIWEILNIQQDEVIYDNPFFQTTTVRRKGCQIDYLIQTRFDTLYICEIKFSKHPIGIDVIEEVKQKIASIALPRRMSYRPVLIHVNGVTEDLLDERYFAKIINFGDLLN